MSIDYSDQNLLFAMTMLRNGVVDDRQFVELMNQWSETPTEDVARLALKNGWVDEEDAAAIERLIRKQVTHHGDLETSLTHQSQFLSHQTISKLSDESLRRLLKPGSPAHDTVVVESPVPAQLDELHNQTISAFSLGHDQSESDFVVGSLSKPGEEPRELSDPQIETVEATGIVEGNQRFEVLRPHAKGGLGKVSIALDKELDREIALKEIRQSFADNEMARERFCLEACITGGLEHPGIVPVYGYGKNADGTPYFAMRFIEGETFKEAVLRFHSLDNKTSPADKRRDFRNLLRRLVDACHAIAYAHNRGILNRDVKPSNIMLGKFGETLVVDWGLAKKIGRDAHHLSEDDSLHLGGAAVSGTLDGSTVGTPTFMSPEQAAGKLEELTPASDIYSLGATLYFLLAGRTAFTGSNAAEVISLVKENAFQHALERNPSAPKALCAISAKAMSTRPQDRYVKVMDLAADIENWLGDEPVSAFHESWLARTGRWLRHHRTLAATAAAAMITIAGASTIGMMFVNAEKNRTTAALAQVSEEKAKTESALGQLEVAQVETKSALASETNARRQTREVLTSITDDFVGELMARQVELGESDKAFFNRVLAQYEEFTSTTGDSAEDQNIRADGYFRVANLHRRLDNLNEADQAYQQAEEIWSTLASTYNTPDARFDLAAVKANHAMLQVQQGQYDSAIEKETEAAKLLETLIAQFPEQEKYQLDYARLLGNRGNAWARLDKKDEAKLDYDQAIKLFEKLVKSSPSLQRDYANSLSNLAGLYSKQPEKMVEAESLYKTVAQKLNALVQLDSSTPQIQRELAVAHQNLGNVLLKQKRRDDAIGHFKKAITTLNRLTQQYPSLATYRRDLGRTQMGLGQAMNRFGMDGGQTELESARTLLASLTQEFPRRLEFKQDLALACERVGATYRVTDFEKAKSLYKQGLELRQTIRNLDPNNVRSANLAIGAEINFANFLRNSEKFEQAIQHYQNVRSELGKQEKPSPKLLRTTEFGLGDSLAKAGQYEASLKSWEWLTKNKQDPNWLNFELQRAICLTQIGQVEAGVKAAEATLTKNHSGLTHYDVACCVAVASTKTDDATQKEVFQKRAVELLKIAGQKQFFDDKKMNQHAAVDGDLDCLRDRDDFKAIVKEFEIAKEPEF